jgi:hypothetical protein
MRGAQANSVAAVRWSTGGDVILAALLFACAVAYLASLPRNLSPADEATYLLEAKRLYDGEVMYRDVFDFITPGYQYLMALAFAVFGPSIGTARVTTAVVHGLIVVVMYATCRRIGVRPSLSAAAAAVHVVVDQSAWGIASQHWVSTLLCTLLLCTFATRIETPTQAARGGVFLGLLALVQQQRALAMAAGAGAWLIGDALFAYRYGRGLSVRALTARLGAFAGAIALIAIPGLAFCIAAAGFDAVWYALIEFPLGKYGVHTSPLSTWGANFAPATKVFSFPRLLAWLPICLTPTLARICWFVLTGRQEEAARRLAWLLAFAGASVLSIAYFPGVAHIAFIAPIFYVVAAENVEVAAQHLGRPGSFAAAAATVTILVLSSMHLARNWSRLWELFPISVDGAFGRVQAAAPFDSSLDDLVKRLADSTPSREVYVHPPFGSVYLVTGARNPTRHCLYTAGFEKDDIITSLEARQPPYAVTLVPGPGGDAVNYYLRYMYEPLPADGWLQGHALRRRPASVWPPPDASKS